MISVVIPVSDQSNRIKKCLLHLLAQHDVDYEIIVIDDASQDSSAQIVKSVLADVEKTRIIVHPTRLGLWQTRREGIRLAQGRTLLFLDPREWLEPGTLKRLSDTMESYNADLVQMRRQRYVHNMPLKLTDHPEAVYWQRYEGEAYRHLARFVGMGSCITPFCGDKLYRTDLLREASNIEFQGNWGEVQVLNINYLRLARSLVLTDFAGINADWFHNYITFKFSHLSDYKRLHTLKRYLCSDTAAVDNELLEELSDYVRQLLGELAWTPEAVAYFVGRELRNPIWEKAGALTNVQALIAREQGNIRRSRMRTLLKRIVR